MNFLHFPIQGENYAKTQVIPMFTSPLSASPRKWSDTQTICRQKQANCLSVFGHLVELLFKGVIYPEADDPYFQMTLY